MINIGINGYGRIGRVLHRIADLHSNLNVVAINDAIRIPIDSANSQFSTPKGRRTIMITGEVKGIILIQKANVPSGLSIIGVIRTKDKISGMVMGKINCWVSASASTAEPIAANNELYIK